MGERISKGERGVDMLAVPEQDRKVFFELEEWALENVVVEGMVMEIAGVYSGVKPAALLEAGYAGDYIGWDENDWADLSEMLGGLGMVMIKRGDDSGDYLLSKGEDIARKLKEAFMKEKQLIMDGVDEDSSEMQDVEREIGGLLGYPATSTEACLSNTERLPDEMKYIKTGEQYDGHEVYEFRDHDMRYAGLVLSREHYKGELEAYARPIRQVIAELLPRIYAKEDFKTIPV